MNPKSSNSLVTGLIIHPPCLSHQTPAPYYSLVRLSATHENDAWYQTNLPLPPNPEDGTSGPKWATEINQIVEHQLPRQWAHRLATDLAKLGSEDSDDDDFDDMEMDGDIDDLEDEGEGEGEGEVDGEGEGEIEEVDPTTDVMAGLDTEDQVYMNRIRIWGITASPGGGVTAVFASQYGTIWPGRDTFAGSKCRVLFGKHDREEADPTLAVKKLSTEARAWEWMYGEAPPVLGVSPGIFKSTKESEKRAALKDHFKMIRRSQTCTFCNEPLKLAGKSSRCRKGHHFCKHPFLFSMLRILYAQYSNVTHSYVRDHRSFHPSPWHIQGLQRVRIQVSQAGGSHCDSAPAQGYHHERDLGGALRRMWWKVY